MDTRRSTLLIAALVSAFLVGFIVAGRASASHQNLYQTTMMPPTHSDGAYSFNSCGWHVGSCYNNTNGTAQDWGYWNEDSEDKYVRFRGWLYRNNTPQSQGYLFLNVLQPSTGPNQCDEAMAEVIEIAPWEVHYRMHYVHTYYTVGGGLGLYVWGNGIGAWNNPTVAYMVDDSGGCPWQPGGYHVHYSAETVGSAYIRNTWLYPCCNYGGDYFQNNTEANMTHRFTWWQGH